MKLTERSKQTNKKNTFIKKKTKIRSPLLEQYMLLFIIAVSLSLNYIHIFFSLSTQNAAISFHGTRYPIEYWASEKYIQNTAAAKNIFKK